MKLTKLFQDKELIEEIRENLGRNESLELLTKYSIDPKKLSEKLNEINQAVEEGTEPNNLSEYEEAIILRKARPALLIQNNKFEVPESDIWKQRLELYRNNIEKAISSVGRIELENHPSYDWDGTGWIVSGNIIVTNRHVARHFATRKDNQFTFKTNPENRRMRARLDFGEEFDTPLEKEFRLVEILYIAEDDQPDMAFFRAEATSLDDENLPSSISLMTEELHSDTEVAVIGYPASNDYKNDPKVIREVFGDIYNVKRLQPGKITSVFENKKFFYHDCSTLGGNSGSVVIDIQSGKAVGLHFAGKFKKENYAIPAKIILDQLNRLD